MIEPFLLKPAGKDYLWGGTRLREEFGKELPLNPLAETWECSTHPDGPSVVDGGTFDGCTLKEVLAKYPEYIGSKYRNENGDLPILIKFIDAAAALSVQVHPDDEYAAKYENGSKGKTEMWYVMDAMPGATLYYGLAHEVTVEEVRSSLADGTFEKHLRRVDISRGDVFYIPAGVVHAIGSGALIAEIQESSNLTYRLYDYNRRDSQGNLRPLHIDKALAVSRLKPMDEPEEAQRKTQQFDGYTVDCLCESRYFLTERYSMDNTETNAVSLPSNTDNFRVLLCMDGEGELVSGNTKLKFEKGRCVFIPAGTEPLKIWGKSQFLCVGV